MAFGASTVSDVAGSVSDLFSGFGATTQADLKAQGLDIQAQGDLAEASNYDLAGNLAAKNEQYTVASTAIKEAQAQRQITQGIGTQQADVAGAGFGSGGSAAFLLADSAAQGALTKSVLAQQGQITEAGYQEQQQSYETMSAAARSTAAGLQNIASETEAAGKTSEFGDFISAGLKGVAAIASIYTGGASDLLTGGFSPTTPSDGNPLVINQYGTPGPTSNNPASPLGAIY